MSQRARKSVFSLTLAAIPLVLGLARPGALAQEVGPEGSYVEPGPPAQPQAPPPPDPKAVKALKLQFEREPSAEEVQKEALRFFSVHPEKVRSYHRGAVWKALMPDLELTYNNDYGNTDRTLWDALYPKFVNYKDLERTASSSYTFMVRAHWALDRLVFNAESLDVASLVGVQEGLLREVTSLYFTRRRLLTSMKLNPPQDPSEEMTESIRLDEITANINALTGGYFTREIRKRSEQEE